MGSGQLSLCHPPPKLVLKYAAF
uniref:Uncharacterized protein n=1 Tax=Anguilla anguilla TaxID=7936 RepID=A0A0E9PY25_ANGAN